MGILYTDTNLNPNAKVYCKLKQTNTGATEATTIHEDGSTVETAGVLPTAIIAEVQIARGAGKIGVIEKHTTVDENSEKTARVQAYEYLMSILPDAEAVLED